MSYYHFNDRETPLPQIPRGTGSRKGQGRLDKEDIQRIVAALCQDATQLVDGELSQDRARATDYYNGEKFGNEEEGRSQVVLTEVRDTVLGTMPSLLRIVHGPERVVEAMARTEAGVPIAAQATDYVNFVYLEDNDGFLITEDVLQDGLVRRLGAVKWGWKKEYICAHEEDDCSEERLQQLAQRAAQQNSDLTLTKVEKDKKGKFTGTVEYTVKEPGRVEVYSVPPEEIIFNRNARSKQKSLLFGHRTEKSHGDLRAMGISEADIKEYGGRDAKLDNNIELVERETQQTTVVTQNPEAGEANDISLYCEVYITLDVDGDGYAELRKVRTLGPGYHVIDTVAADEIPFAIYTPYRQPHTVVGHSQADLVMDIQLVKSSLVRGILDSLALSIYPRTAVVEGMATIEDVLNNEIGAPIRMKREGAVVPFNHPFTGGDAMPVVEYIDGVSEARTGRDKGAAALDADALQSTTQAGVTAAIGASQAQVEMLARGFCEQVLKPMFKGIYRLLVKHQDQQRLAKLRGTYVQVNPAQWEANMDFSVNVALGTSLPEQRIALLTSVANEQKEILQLLGPTNPLVSIAQLRETYVRILALGGIKDVSAFFKPVDPNWAPPPPQGPPPPSPEQINAQAQIQMKQMEVEKDLQIKEAELKLKAVQQKWQQEFEVRKAAMDFVLRREQIVAQFKTDYSQAQAELDAAQEEKALNGAIAVRAQQHEETKSAREHALATQDQAHEQALERDQQAHDQEMAQQAQDTAASQAAPGSEQ